MSIRPKIKTNLKYDFETVPTRMNTGSEKWRDLEKDAKNENKSIPENVIPFSVADMEFVPIPEITKGLTDFLKNHVLGYTCATDEYKQVVCDYFQRRHGYRPDESELVETRGVVEGVFSAVRAFSKVGDGIIMLTPVYYPLYRAIEYNGRKLLRCPLILTDKGYIIDFELFEELAKEAKLFILCSPHNPTGRVWKKEELERLGDICLKNNVFVISDEIHMDITMKKQVHTIFASISPEFANNSIIFTSPSKSYNLAGLQTSNAFIKSPKRKAEFLRALENSFAFNECGVLGYTACSIAYRKGEKWLKKALAVIEQNKEIIETFVKENLPNVRVCPLEGTYLLWLDMRKTGLSKEELEKLMKQNFLYFDEGYIFGEEGEGFERWNIACPTKYVEAALFRLKIALS
jgi:putative C-S lyase